MEMYQHSRGHRWWYRRLAIIAAAVTAIIIPGLAIGGTALAAAGTPASAVAAAVPGHAASVPNYSCSGQANTSSRTCYFHIQRGDAPLFYPSGSLHLQLPPNDSVLVTCYYRANSPSGWLNDGVQDHVSWTQVTGNTTGHIPDVYMNEGGENPWQGPFYLSQCA